MAGEVKVIQADRDAAASVCSKPDLADAVRRGEADNASTVQAFARHRVQSQAELVEALQQAAADFEEHAQHAQTRLEDGDDLGSTVWKIALEDIKREAMDNASRVRTALANATGAA